MIASKEIKGTVGSRFKVLQKTEVLEGVGPWPPGPLLATPPHSLQMYRQRCGQRGPGGLLHWKIHPAHVCALEARAFRCLATMVSSCPCFLLWPACFSASLPLSGCPDILLNQMPSLQKVPLWECGGEVGVCVSVRTFVCLHRNSQFVQACTSTRLNSGINLQIHECP